AGSAARTTATSAHENAFNVTPTSNAASLRPDRSRARNHASNADATTAPAAADACKPMRPANTVVDDAPIAGTTAMASAPPIAAPPETPSTYGSASGFFINACNAAPVDARPAPTTT